MKLHLPVSLRRAVMKVLAALALPLATTVASGTTVADSIGKGNLGKTMFVGDSITHGAHADLYSWRWSMHKILVDNGISYEEVGVKTGNTKDLGTDMLYGTKVFQNVHSAQCSARAYEIAERKAAGQFEGTGIQHWLGENEPDAWPEANKNKDGFKLTEEQKPVDTFFMLIGTNDWLSDGVTEQSRVADKAAGIEKNLIGRTVEDGTAEEKQVKWSGTGDLDTIVNTMFSHNSDASLVLLTVPTWGTHTAVNGYKYVKEDYKTVQEYNVHLKEWVEQNKNKASITLVDTNLGLIDVANTEMPGKGVDSFFYSSSDRLHPSTQGELIIAGNVAKQLGIAGRTAGQERKAGSDFQLKTTDFVDGGTTSNVTTDEGKLQFAASNGTYTHDWGGASPTGGYTVEFKLDGGIGDGASGGWNTTDYFSVSVGSGTTGGTLNINEAYIQWGSTVLYSLDTSTGNLGEGKWDAIRIAYIMGNPTLGLPTGFYVWLGDQLIGEGLSSTGATDGLSIANKTAGSVTLSELYMDANSWAPTTTLKMVSNPTIAPESPPEYRDFAGEKEWASDGLQPGEIDVSKLKESLESYSGATVSSGTLPTGGLLTEAHRGDIYVTFTGGVKSSTFESFFQNNSASITGDVYLRFLNLDPQSLGTFFVINGSYKYGVEGDMYLEFSSKNLNISSGNFNEYKEISVAAGYDMGCISGTYRMVFNDATLNGDVYGGFVGRSKEESKDLIKVGGVELYLNGGEFKGNIYAGGWGYGSVGAGDAGGGAKRGRSIIITGDDATFTGGTDKVISLGGRDNSAAVATVDGDATLTISGVSQSGGIAQFTGTLDGGAAGEYTRSLVITGGTAIAEMKASVTNFDKITVLEGSVIGLKLKGTGLKSIEIEADSELDIAADEANDVQLSNGGATLVLRSGATLSATVAASDEKGTIIVENGGALTLTDGSAAAAAASLDGIALAAEGPSVQQDVTLQGGGSYTAGTAQMNDVLVTLDGGGTYTIGANVESAQIRLTLTGMTSASSIAAGGTYKDYGITLVGANKIELGEGMQTTAFFGTSGNLTLEAGAKVEIGLSAIMKTLRDGSEPLTYKLAKSSLGAWNSNEKVKIARELDLLGWTATFTAQGELQLTKTATSTPGDLYWDGGTDTDGLIWGGEGSTDKWAEGSSSQSMDQDWTDRSSAHLSGGGTITMGGDVIVNNLEFGDGTYTFTGGHSLSVLGTVTQTAPTVNFGTTSVEVLGDLEVTSKASFTFDEHLVVQGKVKWWSNKALTLSEGATFGELDPSWSRGDILLGGDLVLTKGLCTQNDGKLVTFKNSGSEAVYLVFNTGGVVKERTEKSGSNGEQEGIRICSSTNTGNYGFYVFENVGIAAKGRGTILKLLDGSETQWDVGGNLLAAEQGTLVIDGAHPMVVTGKILADGGTISTTLTTANVSASGLEAKNSAEVSTNGTWTISGAVSLDDTSTLTIQGGKLDLTGNAASSFEGHLVLDGGELSTSTQDLTIKELRVASGGKLTINGDTSIESLTSSQSLTSLTIAEGKKLSLQSGTLKLGREFSWGEGSTLKLTGANVVLDATDLILFGESDSSVGNLTIDLSTAFLEGIGGSNQRRLFSSRWDSSWTDKITLTVDGKTPTGDYEGLHISSDGKLVWNEETDQLFWGAGDSAHTSLTLGTGEQTWGAEKGSDTGATWSGTPSVSLEATSGTVTVNVGEGATMKNFSTADVSGDSSVTYNLTATNAKTATVNGTLSVGSKTTLSVGNNVTLDVKGTYSGTGTLKLEGGNVSFGSTEGTTITNVTLAANANSDVTLKGNLTVEVLTGDNWDNPSDLTIKNATETSESPLTFTVNSENESGNNLWSAFTLGGPTARIDLIKTGTGMQSLGVGKIEIFGDVTVSAGILRITAASAGSIIHGKVSGSGQLRLASNTSITIEGKDGDAGSIGTLNCYAASNSSPTLYLGGDLTFKEVLSDGDSDSHGSLTLNRATVTQGVANAPGVVYLLWDSTGQSGGLTWTNYKGKFGTIKHGSNEDGFADDTGYGKAGDNELTISDAATIDGNFKVKEGTMTFSEAATLTADKHIVVGDSAKLNFSGGIDGRSGTLTSLTLSNGAGVEFESGTLKSKALTLSGSATLTLKVASGSGANLDLGVITFSGDENTKLTIKLNGWADAIKTEGYQLFDVSEGSQWSTAKEAILGLFSRFVFQDGNGTAIGDVKLTEEGRLVLSDPTTTVDTYTWSGTDGKVTLGDSISDGKSLGWDTDSGAVDASKTVVLNGTGAEGTETVTVTVSGSGEQDPEVNVKALTVGDTAGGTTAYTFSGTGEQKLTVEETLTLNTPTTFESTVSVKAKQLVVNAGESGAVNFAGGLTLTNGTTAGGLTITKGNVTFSGGTVDIGAGSLLGQYSTIGDGASLTVEAGVQLESLGLTQLESGATLTLKTLGTKGEKGWNANSNNSIVWGANATLIFDGITATSAADFNDGFLPGGESYTLGELRLSGSRIATNSTRFQHVTKMVVGSDSTLELTADIFTTTAHPEVHISGTGYTDAGAALVYTPASDAEQGRQDHTHIVLDANATISNAGTIWFMGSLSALQDNGVDGVERHMLKKAGEGFFQVLATSTVTNVDFDVAGGRLLINLDTDDENGIRSTTVTLSGGHLKVGGGGQSDTTTLTLKALEGTTDNSSIYAGSYNSNVFTLTLSDDTAEAEHGIKADLGYGSDETVGASATASHAFNLTKAGQATQKFEGKVNLGTVAVQGGKLEFDLTGDGTAGAVSVAESSELAVKGHTLTISDLSGQGSVTGDGALKVSTTSTEAQTFGGTISSNLEYNGTGTGQDGATSSLSLSKAFGGTSLTVSAGTLTLEQALTTGNRTVTLNGGTLKLAAGGTIDTLAGTGGTLDITGTVSVTSSENFGLTGLKLSSSGKLEVGAGITTVGLGEITLAGAAELSLGGTSNLKLSGTWAEGTSNTLTLSFTEAFLNDVVTNHSGTYELIDSAGATGWNDSHVTFADVEGYTVAWETDGTIKVTATAVSADTWKVDGASNVWNTTDANWGNGVAWASGAAKFSNSQGDEEISVAAPITADSMDVSGGGKWAFKTTETNSLTVSGATTVSGKGTTLTLDGSGHFTFTGGITVNEGAEVVVTGGKGSDFSGAVSGEGSLTLEFAESTTVIDYDDNSTGVKGLVGDSLGSLKFKASSTGSYGVRVKIDSNLATELGKISDIWVDSGVTLQLSPSSGQEGSFASEEAAATHTLHLKGVGSTGSNARGAQGALHFAKGETIAWKTRLEDATSITVTNSATAVLKLLDGNSCDFDLGIDTSTTTGKLQIQGLESALGNVTIQHGELTLDFDTTSFEKKDQGYVASKIDVKSNASLVLSAGSEARIYAVGALVSSDDKGSVKKGGEEGDTGTVTLQISNSETGYENVKYLGSIGDGIDINVTKGYWSWNSGAQSAVSITVGESAHVSLESAVLMGKVKSSGELVLDGVSFSGEGATLEATGGSVTVKNAIGSNHEVMSIADADLTFENTAVLSGGMKVTGGTGKTLTFGGVKINGVTGSNNYLDLSGYSGSFAAGTGTGEGNFSLVISATGRTMTTVDAENEKTNYALKLTADQMGSLNALTDFKIEITDWVTDVTGIDFLDLEGWDYEKNKTTLTSFLEHITVGEDAASGKYTIDENGHLILVPEETDDLYWGAAGSDTTITLGTGGDAEWSGKSGSTGTLSWGIDKNVHLEATSGTIAVTVGADATMKSLTVGAGATYNLTVAEGTPQTATVTEALTNNATLLSIGSNVTLGVQGTYEGNGALEVAGGTLKLGASVSSVTGAVSMGSGGTLELAGAVTLSGLKATDAGGTANVKLGSAGVLNASGVNGANLDLNLTTTNNRNSDSFALTGGGTLKSLTGDTYTIGKLTGTWTLKEASSIGILKMAANDTLDLTIGGDFTVNSLRQGTWNNASGISFVVKNGQANAGSVDFILDQKYTDAFDVHTITFGDPDSTAKKVNFVRHGTDAKMGFSIGAAIFTLYGDFTDDAAGNFDSYSSTIDIHGAFSKTGGEFRLTNSTLTIDGKEGSTNKVDKLVFRGSDAAGTSSSTINLGADLVFGELSFITQDDKHTFYGTGTVNKSVSGGDVYLLWNFASDSPISATDFVGKYGTLTFNTGAGMGVTIASSTTREFNEGTEIEKAFKVTGGGTLKLSDSTTGYTFSGGLTLDGGTLELAGTQGLTVKTALSWKDNPTLKLSSSTSGLTINLSELNTLNGGQSTNHELTLDFTTGFLDAVGTGYKLFNWGENDFSSYFTLKVDGQPLSGTYQNLELRSDGTLFWGDVKDLYWSDSARDGELAWGTNGTAEWATSAGTTENEAWASSANVHLGATGKATVTLEDTEITAGTVSFTAANATDGYTFSSDVEGGTKLTVAGITNSDSSAVGVKATFGEGVNVRVTGNFTNHNARSEYTFEEELIVDGQLSLWGTEPNTEEEHASVLTLKKGATVGDLEASWNGKFVLGGDLVIKNWTFVGNSNGGHHAWFARLSGVEKEVYVDVQTTMELRRKGGGGTLYFRDGVGIKSSVGTLTFVGDDPFEVGGSFAAVNGGSMTFNTNAEAKMNVEVGENSTITISAEKTLTTSGLTGWQGVEGMTYGTIGGDGTLVLNDATGGGDFKGAVSSNFTYAGSESTTAFTLSGEFSGKSLTVSKGKLTLTGTTSLGGAGKSVEVAAGAELEIGTAGQEVSVDTQGGLTLNGTLTLNGGTKNTVSGDVTLSTDAKLDFKAGSGNAVSGVVMLNGGTLAWTGGLSVGSLAGTAGIDNAANGGSLTLTGASSSYGQEIKLGEGTLATTGTGTHELTGALTAGSVNVGSGTTLKLGTATLSGESNTVAGSLELAGGSMKGLTGAGAVATTGELTLSTADGYKGDLTIGDAGSVTAADSLHVGSLNGKGGISLGENKTITFEDASAETQAVYEGTISGENVSLEMKAGDQKLTQAFNGAGVTVSGGALELAGGLSTSGVAVNLTGGALTLAGGTITSLAGGSEKGGNLTITGALEVGTVSGKLGTLALGDSQLTLKGGTLDVTDLTAGEGSLAISLTGNVQFADSMGELGLTSAITVHLNADEIGSYLDEGYQLFAGNVNTDDFNFVVDGGSIDYKVTLKDGKLVFTEKHDPLTWNGSGDLTWESAGAQTADGWSHNETFGAAQDVTFHGTAQSDVTVSLDGAIEVDNMVVGETGENVTGYVFKATEGVSDVTLKVDGTLTLNDATTFEVTTEVRGALQGAADLTVKGNLTLDTALDGTTFTGGITLDGGALDLKGATNTLGTLIVGTNGGTLSGKVTSGSLTSEETAGKLTLSDGEMTLSGSTKGEVEVGGTLTGSDLTVGGLTGSGILKGSITVDGAGGTFDGTINEPLELTVRSGTQSFSQNATLSDVALNGGTLNLAAGGTVASLNGAGGALEVGGTVEVGSVKGSLTKLTLGDGATMHVGGEGAQTLTVGGLTWGKDAKLELDSQFTIALAEVALAQPGEGGQLTIDLSSDVLDSLGSGNWQLFDGWSGEDWTQYFMFTIDGQAVDADRYGEFGLDEDGRLTWSEPSLSDLYWDASKDDDKTLTWGGEGTEWSSSPSGEDPSVAWPDDDSSAGVNVHVAGAEGGEYNVEMSGDVTAKDVEFNGGDYTFAGEGSKLTTEGDLTVGTDKKTTVNFGNKQLDVGGNLTLGSGSSVTADSKLDVAGDVNVGSGTLTANSGGTWGSAQVAPGGSLSMTGTTVTGGVKMGNGSSVTMEDSTVNGELSVEGGKLTVGGKSTLGSVSGTLTGLEIAKDGSLTVNGNGLAADSFTWGSGSTLHLGSGFTGTLDFGSMDGDGNLTLDFSSQFLEQLGSGGTLFGGEVSDFSEGWNERFNLTVDGKTPGDSYGDLKIGENGALTWVPKAKDKDKYDSSKDNDTANDGTQTEWNTKDPTDPSKDKNIYDSVGDYGQVVVDSDTNINFGNADKDAADGDWSEDGLTVHNLNGTNSNAELTITGDGKDNKKVTLKNSYSSKETQGEVEYSDDLTYSGGITVEKAELHINHEDTNPASLHHGAEWGTVMGGELNLSQGQGLYMDRGVLKLQNEANQLTDVTFTNDRDGQLVVDGGSATVSGDIVLGGGEAVYTKDENGNAVNRNHVHLENGGTLELDGEKRETTVGAGVVIGGNDASGSAVGMKGKVSMEKGSRISGLHLILENKDTVLTVGANNEPETAAYALAAEEPEGDLGTPESNADAEANKTFSIYGIQSNGGHLTGTQDMVINVRDWDHVFTGSMKGYSGKMTFNCSLGRQQYFTQVTDGSSGWDMEVNCLAYVTLDVLNSKGRNAGWEMGNVTLGAGSQTTLGFTFSSGGVRSASATGMTFGSFRLAEGAGITLQAYGSAMPTDERFVLGQMTEGGAVDLHWHWDGSEVAAANEEKSKDLELKRNQLVGGAWLHVESAKIVHDDTNKQIVLEMEMALGNALAEAVQGIHQNATEGANALWQLTDTVNNPKANEALNDPNSDTSKLSAEAQRLMSNGNKSELAKLLAAAAGAGYTGYSAALGEDMHRQLTAIRNRTTSMGDEAAAARDEDMPYWHAWLNAESSYRELDADDLAPGYRVNGWGGTFGVDADISRNTTLGLALTAMYNDLKCTGADSISGDMDTMYATAFLRHMRGRWMHTIVLSGGTADFKTHRTVMSGSGNYTADADTSGYSLGALYEIGYTTVLSKDSRRVMQYVFNVEARHNSIDGFTESGSDAGLVVDDMDSLTVTFGLGARLQSLFGGKVYNRSALFEARFLVKADAGDRRGEAATRFINGSYVSNMVGAEVGAVGVELGAGLTVPVGSTPYSGSFFIDGSLEFRQGWTSFDATLGYRISF